MSSSKPVLLGFAALSLLMLTCVAWAQTVQAPQSAAVPVTLEQAVQRGQAQRLSIRIAQAEVEAARARVNQARALQWPSVDLTANTSNITNYDSFSGINASVIFPGMSAPSTLTVTSSVPRYQTSGGVQLRYPLYTGGRITAQIKRQEQALLAIEVKHRITLRDVALEIAQTYFRLRSACVQYDSAQRRAQLALKDLKRAQQRLHDGRIAAIDASQAELTLTENQVALRARREDLDIAQADFIASQNEVPGPTDASAPSCGFTSEITTELAWLDALADTALETEYNQLQVRAAQETVQIESAALKPQLTVTAEYAGIGRSTNTYSGAFDDFKRQRAAVGVDFSIKLFDGGLTRERVAEAQAETKRLSLIAERDTGQRKQTRQRDEFRVRIAQGRVELAQARLELAQKQTAIARERQNSGSGSAAAVDEQTEREHNAQDEYRLAELDLALARIATLLPSSRIQPGVSETPGPNDQEKPNHG